MGRWIWRVRRLGDCALDYRREPNITPPKKVQEVQGESEQEQGQVDVVCFMADWSNYISRTESLIKGLHLGDILAYQGASLRWTGHNNSNSSELKREV